MVEIVSRSFLYIAMVETFDVLPSIACLAVYRVAIIVRVIANALDRIRLFLIRLVEGQRIFCRAGPCNGIEHRLSRRRDMRW